MPTFWLSPSAPLLLVALRRWLVWLAEEDGTKGAAYTAEDVEVSDGFSPSPSVGTNGFAEDVKPLPT